MINVALLSPCKLSSSIHRHFYSPFLSLVLLATPFKKNYVLSEQLLIY